MLLLPDAPDPAGKSYSAPTDPEFMGRFVSKRKGGKGKEKQRAGRTRKRKGMENVGILPTSCAPTFAPKMHARMSS